MTTNIFVLHDGVETGPFTWVDVFVMLERGDLDEGSLIWIGEESKPIAQWGFWSEGAEAGPFTWDEVSTLLQAGILDLDTPAKLEGASELTNLREVISRSREVGLISEGQGAADSSRRINTIGDQEIAAPWSFQYGKVAAMVAAFLCGIALLFYLGGGSQDLPKDAAVEETKRVTAEDEPRPEAPEFQDTPPPAIAAALKKDEPRLPLPISAAAVETESSSRAVVVPMASETVTPPPVQAAMVPDAPESQPGSRASEVSLANSANDTPSNPVSVLPAPESSPITPRTAKIAHSPTPKPTATPEAAVAVAGNFFEIQAVKLLKKPPKDGMGVWRLSTDKKKPVPDEFQPCLEVKVEAKENIRSDKLTAKAYFFNGSNTLLASALKPSKAGMPSQCNHHEMPVLFYQDKADNIFFEVPEKIRNGKWKAVVVFGDKHEARSACFPTTESDFLLTYPEKELVYDRTAKRVARKAAMDPLIEHVVKTRNPNMPQITLFLRPPKGITDASEVQGVLAICVLANSLEDMKRDLHKEEMPGDYAGLFSFANKHKLAIVAWGSRRLWDPGRNYDDLPKDQARKIDESLDTVATAWERGIKELGEKYGIPQSNFLLWGNCGSAQWAQRLCLRKPEYFLAVHIHMPGSYDKPTPDAAKVLWCLTIGELEGGYERSKRWVKTVREMGYPIVYKAIPGLGHAGHPNAAALGFEFYSYALQQKDKRTELDRLLEQHPDWRDIPKPWPNEFRNPALYGDIVNQVSFSFDQLDMIPSSFRIALPTKEVAAIWQKEK